jgi:hypothetical protein
LGLGGADGQGKLWVGLAWSAGRMERSVAGVGGGTGGRRVTGAWARRYRGRRGGRGRGEARRGEARRGEGSGGAWAMCCLEGEADEGRVDGNGGTGTAGREFGLTEGRREKTE